MSTNIVMLGGICSAREDGKAQKFLVWSGREAVLPSWWDPLPLSLPEEAERDSLALRVLPACVRDG